MNTSYRTLLFTTFVFFLTISVQVASGQVQFGLVGGANFASLSDIEVNNQSVNLDNATAFHGGIFVDLNIGPINARPALYYLNAGALFEGSIEDTSGPVDDNFNLAYITLPIDFILNFGLGPVKAYFFLGPEFRIFTPSGIPDDVERGIESFVYNGTTGLGVKLNIPGIGVTLYPHLRYSFGLSNYTNSNYEFEGRAIRANDANVRMWLLSLGIGL